MFKKCIYFTLIIFVVIGVINPMPTNATNKPIVLVGEGGLQTTVVKGIAQINNEYCAQKEGYFNLDFIKNEIRVEVDEKEEYATGAGNIAIAYSQKCPGEPLAKLVKESGVIEAKLLLSGFYKKGEINGTFKMLFNVPALITFSGALDNQEWTGTYKNGLLYGEFHINSAQFGFNASFPYQLTTKKEEAIFITDAPKILAGFNSDLISAQRMAESNSYDERNKALEKLNNLKRKLPLDKGPRNELDPLPEFEALIGLFNGYITCVQKNVEQQSGGNPQWEECLYSAGAMLERAETFARLVKPTYSASAFYLQLAGQWDRMRYFALYAPERVQYDKVECCERAKKLANSAFNYNRENIGAETLLAQLKIKGGCNGMPLFGINREAIAKQEEAALEEARRLALEQQADDSYFEEDKDGWNYNNEDDFIDDLQDTASQYEPTPEQKEQLTQNLKEASNTILNEAKVALEQLEKSDNQETQSLKEMKRQQLERMKKLAEELNEDADSFNLNSRVLRNYAERTRDLFQSVKDLQDFTDYVRTGKIGGYDGMSLFTDATGTFIDYKDNRARGASAEDAAYKAAVDNFGVSALTSIPMLKAIDIVTTAPDKLLNALGVDENSDVRTAAKTLTIFSPSRLVKDTSEILTYKTKEWSEFGDAFSYQWKKVKNAEGGWNTTKETGKLAAGALGATVVGTMKISKDGILGATRWLGSWLP